MDLRVAHFSAHTSQEFDSATTPVGLERQLPLLVLLCAISGAILFAFLVILIYFCLKMIYNLITTNDLIWLLLQRIDCRIIFFFYAA